jgi:hypothetical protein
MYAPNVHEVTQHERDIMREQRERIDAWHDDAISATCEVIESDEPIDASIIPV